ncbi:hypothetical protein ACFCV3_41730 [Kribbella sp. NPDC056345]|uniref:hypothetical protein n=1 Tax=Kribbella sp. NPDC056345 TaxID=3345789 RepID=UPI0035DE39B2
MIGRRTAIDPVQADLKVAAVLTRAGICVDDVSYWASRISTAARVTADKKVARLVVGRFLDECGVPANNQAKLVAALMKAARR